MTVVVSCSSFVIVDSRTDYQPSRALAEKHPHMGYKWNGKDHEVAFLVELSPSLVGERDVFPFSLLHLAWYMVHACVDAKALRDLPTITPLLSMATLRSLSTAIPRRAADAA